MLVSLDIETKRDQRLSDGPPELKRDFDALIPHRAEITCIGVVTDTGRQHVFRGPDKIFWLKSFLYDVGPELQLVGQNFKFDIRHLVHLGMDAEFLIKHWKHDTQLLAYVHPEKVHPSFMRDYEKRREEENAKLPRGYSHRQASLHSLKTLAPYFLGVEPFWEDPTNHNNDEYVLKDCLYTLELCKYFLNNMHEKDLDFYSKYQLPWTKELLRAELTGINVDVNELHNLRAEFEGRRVQAEGRVKEQWTAHFLKYQEESRAEELARIDEMERRAILRLKDESRIPGVIARHDEKRALVKGEEFNLNSPTQLKWLLKEALGLDISKIDGSESTDKEVLETLASAHPEIHNFLEYRKLNKLCTSYFPSYEDFIVRGRIHASFNPTGTKTGRLSSSHPNLQQMPKEVRPMFKPDEGYKYISYDASAIEPRILAYYSEDKTLCDVFLNDLDFHGVTATAMFNYIDCPNKEVKKLFPKERGVAKTLGLAILYGSSHKMVKEILYKAGFTDYNETDCRRIVDNIRSTYKDVWKFKLDLDKELERGHVVYNLLGRPIKFARYEKDDIYIKGLNRLIQGSASDLVINAAANFNDDMRFSRMDAEFLALVHDEILVRAEEGNIEFAERALKHFMTKFELNTKFGRIPLAIEGGIKTLYWEK
jgi:DNA polymerase I-like protein with 3'-5' exonuclease and polymerase domains